MRRQLVKPALALLVLVLVPVLGGCGGSGATVPLAYVASAGNNHVRVIDLETGEALRRIYTGAGPWRLVPSPDGKRLWVQHWYAGTTAVIDLDDHEVTSVLPFRGPGSFEADGSAFVTFNWPSSDLHRIEKAGSDHPQVVETYATKVKQAYDVTLGPDGKGLFIAQFDPIAKGMVPRYGAVAALDHHSIDESPNADETGEGEESQTPAEMEAFEAAASGHPILFEPRSIATGRSPRKVLAVPGQPFVLTADSETNGITLINPNADRRVLAVCPAPLDLLVTPDLGHLVVLCWDENRSHASQVVSFKADFAARPWPSLEKESETEVTGALVAGAIDPSGEHVLAVDRQGGRMVELSIPELEVTRTMETGDVPLDVEVVEVPAAVRDRLRSGVSDTRERVRQALGKMMKASAGGAETTSFDTLAWTELVSWLASPDEGAETEDGDRTADEVEQTREVLVVLHAPDVVRTEIPEGGVRLAGGGHSLSLDPDGRFWVTPRQDIATLVYALPNLSLDEAVRRLAGDVPGSPFLRGGLAVDVIEEVRESGEDFLVIGGRPGAPSPGEGVEPVQVSELWIQSETGQAAELIEQFPVFDAGGHGSAAPKAAETKFFEYAPVTGPDGKTGPVMPRRLERMVEGGWLQHVQLQDFHVDPDLPANLFDIKLLGDKQPAPGVLFRTEPVDRKPAAGGEPGWAVATENSPDPIQSPLAPFRPYLTSPPTSGPYLPFTADWGVHETPVPLPLQAHNLLDGGIALQYHCPVGCPDLVQALEEIAASHDDVLVAPYPWMEAKLAVTAWGRMETLGDTELGQDGWRQDVERFIEAYAGIDHHLPGEGTGAPMVGSH